MRDAQRRVAVVAQVVDLAAELAQGIDQVANRPLMHACHAAQFKLAAQQGQRGRERAHGRAGIAKEQLRRRLRRAPAQAGDAHLRAVFIHAAAELAQGIEHDAGVVGGQQVVHRGGAVAQCGQQQHAVGNAFGAGQLHIACDSLQRGQVKKGSAEHLSVFGSALCAHAPVRAGFAGQGEHVLDGLGIAFTHGFFEALQGLLKQAGLGQ